MHKWALGIVCHLFQDDFCERELIRPGVVENPNHHVGQFANLHAALWQVVIGQILSDAFKSFGRFAVHERDARQLPKHFYLREARVRFQLVDQRPKAFRAGVGVGGARKFLIARDEIKSGVRL